MIAKVDITVVGGGIAGAALGLALAKKTRWNLALVDSVGPLNLSDRSMSNSVIDSRVIDGRGIDSRVINSRVVALNEASIQWLKDLDIWPSIEGPRACAYRQMRVWDGEGTGEVCFDAAAIHESQLGVIVENNHLINQLWLGLQATGRVQTLIGDGVTNIAFKQGQSKSRCELLLASGARLQTQLTIAADGAESAVRKASGIAHSSVDYGHHALIATVQVRQPHNGCALQRFSTQGPLAFLPLASQGDKHFCAIVWSQTHDQAQALQAMDDETFKRALARAIEWSGGDIPAVYHRAAIALKERHAESYFQQGVALIGDAAHTLHPLAGQGVNLGLADAKALFEELQRAETRGLSLSEPSILARYQRERRAHNSATIKAMRVFKTLFEQQNPWITLLRNEGMRAFNASGWLKQQAIKVARNGF
jgi:2-octaprenylphenol hydroxylase